MLDFVALACRRQGGRCAVFSCGLLCFLLCVLFQPLASAKTRQATTDPGYVSALTAADHLLQAWQSADPESGMVLLTDHAKHAATTEVVERFFADPGPSAYEIAHGKLLKSGRYEFPVVLILGSNGESSKKPALRRRFSSIVVVNTGHNEWAVDKLP